MKKVILLTVVLFVVSVSTFAQDSATADTRERVRIEVSGFDNDLLAHKFIRDYLRKDGDVVKDWTFVQMNPRLAYRVNLSTQMIKSWRHINNGAAMRNSLLSTGNDFAQAACNQIPGYNQIAAVVRENCRRTAYNQTEQRKRVVETTMEKWEAVADLSLIDVPTGTVLYRSVGRNAIVVQRYPVYDGEPLVILAEGDLSSVQPPNMTLVGVNLNGNMRQLLALSAFMNASKPESNIVDDSK